MWETIKISPSSERFYLERNQISPSNYERFCLEKSQISPSSKRICLERNQISPSNYERFCLEKSQISPSNERFCVEDHHFKSNEEGDALLWELFMHVNAYVASVTNIHGQMKGKAFLRRLQLCTAKRIVPYGFSLCTGLEYQLAPHRKAGLRCGGPPRVFEYTPRTFDNPHNTVTISLRIHF